MFTTISNVLPLKFKCWQFLAGYWHYSFHRLLNPFDYNKIDSTNWLFSKKKKMWYLQCVCYLFTWSSFVLLFNVGNDLSLCGVSFDFVIDITKTIVRIDLQLSKQICMFGKNVLVENLKLRGKRKWKSKTLLCMYYWIRQIH